MLMMTRLLLVVFFLTSQTVDANESKDPFAIPGASKGTDGKAPKKSSRANRTPGKVYGILEPIGLSIYPGTGGHVGFVASPGISYEASTMHSISNLGGTSKFKTNRYMARIRTYPGNSFNISFGMGLRNTTVNFDAEKHFSARSYEPVDEQVEVQTVGGQLHIGNRWQFSSFLIGCDWVGVYAPMLTLSKKYTDKSVVDEDKDREREVNFAEKEADLFLVNFHIGFLF
jgi:hypothetical protein